MPHVVASGSECGQFTGGLTEFDVEADTVRRMILELEGRFPGLGAYVEKRMAVAIDGVIHQDAYAARLAPGAEVYLIPKIGGG